MISELAIRSLSSWEYSDSAGAQCFHLTSLLLQSCKTGNICLPIGSRDTYILKFEIVSSICLSLLSLHMFGEPLLETGCSYSYLSRLMRSYWLALHSVKLDPLHVLCHNTGCVSFEKDTEKPWFHFHHHCINLLLVVQKVLSEMKLHSFLIFFLVLA